MTLWNPDVAKVDPLDHHYIMEAHLGWLRHDQDGLKRAIEGGAFCNPYGWDAKAAQRSVMTAHGEAYRGDLHRAAVVHDAAHVRQRTEGEKWHDQSQKYFHDIEDKVLTALAAETHRQWREEREAKRRTVASKREAEVTAVAATMNATRLQCEATGASIVGPTRTVTSSRLAHTVAPSAVPVAHFPPTHYLPPASVIHHGPVVPPPFAVPATHYATAVPGVGFGAYAAAVGY